MFETTTQCLFCLRCIEELRKIVSGHLGRKNRSKISLLRLSKIALVLLDTSDIVKNEPPKGCIKKSDKIPVNTGDTLNLYIYI